MNKYEKYVLIFYVACVFTAAAVLTVLAEVILWMFGLRPS